METIEMKQVSQEFRICLICLKIVSVIMTK